MHRLKLKNEKNELKLAYSTKAFKENHFNLLMVQDHYDN